MKQIQGVVAAAALGLSLTLAACGGESAPSFAVVDDHDAASSAAMAEMDQSEHADAGGDHGPAHGGGESMWTPTDPGGLTPADFMFHTIPGNRHIVRLPAPGSDTWKVSADVTGAPSVKLIETRGETLAGAPVLVAEFEMVEAGTVPVKFERHEGGSADVEGELTVNFMVH
ncbi:hypothetical protein GC169_07790 [bacterium]|nr:hypothetical protein [bacterium]